MSRSSSPAPSPCRSRTPYHRIKFKILVMGDSGVGKSCLVQRYADNFFSPKHHFTIGIDFKTVPVVVAGTDINLQIWDTAGEERFRAMMPVYYRNSQGVLLVYDLTSATSFHNIAHWLQEIRDNCPRDVNILMVANKCDEVEKRQITQEQMTRYATLCGIPFQEASAKTGEGVKDLFDTLSLSIFNRLVEQLGPPRNPWGDDGQPRPYPLEAAQNWLQAGQGGQQAGRDRFQAGQDDQQVGQDSQQAGQDSQQAGQVSFQAGQVSFQAGQNSQQPEQDRQQAGKDRFKAGHDRGYDSDVLRELRHRIRLKRPEQKRDSGFCC